MQIQLPLNIRKIFLEEKKAIIATLLVVGSIQLWLFQSPKPPKTETAIEQKDLGQMIPDGFVLVPIELSNSTALSSMIQTYGVIDVIVPQAKSVLIKNLKILKIQNEGPEIFGALVSQDKVTLLDSIFSQKKLKGVLKKNQSKLTIFKFENQKRDLVIEIPLEE